MQVRACVHVCLRECVAGTCLHYRICSYALCEFWQSFHDFDCRHVLDILATMEAARRALEPFRLCQHLIELQKPSLLLEHTDVVFLQRCMRGIV